MKDAFRALLNTKADLKISLAIELYLKGNVSIGRAAELAGMTTIEFKDVLAGRGIVRETEGKTAKEMDKKLQKLGDSLIIFADAASLFPCKSGFDNPHLEFSVIYVCFLK